MTRPRFTTRRRLLKGLGVTGAAALAGCDETGTGNPSTDEPSSGLPPEDEGVEEWKERLNDHAREANIEWNQFADEDITLRFGMGLHPYSTTTEKVKDGFTELTGIEVEYEIISEDQFWLQAEQAMADQSGNFDGFMVGLWPAGGYHEPGWVLDLNQFITDASLTDQDWLAMNDFRDDTIELMTFPDGEGGRDFIGFPNGIEAYGCPAIDVPTFEQLGIDDPTTAGELEAAARQISESDEVDRESKEAALNSPQGVASLERFGRMLNEYGPENPGTRDWYRNNNTFSEGEVAIMYSTPQTSGIVSEEQIERTRFLPPVAGPDGEDPIVDTWIWATGISAFSDNPEAAWLYIQWANSREANYMLSTRQWQGDQPRAGYARWDYIFDRNSDDPDTPEPPEGYENAFREGMDGVPVDPPPVPVDTPQNMNIMSEAAQAMSSVVSGNRTAQAALDDVAPQVTEYAQQVPERYITRN